MQHGSERIGRTGQHGGKWIGPINGQDGGKDSLLTKKMFILGREKEEDSILTKEARAYQTRKRAWCLARSFSTAGKERKAVRSMRIQRGRTSSSGKGN